MSIRETVEENKEILWLEDKLEVYLYCAGRRETEVVFMVVGSEKEMGFYTISRTLAEALGPGWYFYLGDRKEHVSPENLPDVFDDAEWYCVPVRVLDWDGDTLEERGSMNGGNV